MSRKSKRPENSDAPIHVCCFSKHKPEELLPITFTVCPIGLDRYPKGAFSACPCEREFYPESFPQDDYIWPCQYPIAQNGVTVPEPGPDARKWARSVGVPVDIDWQEEAESQQENSEPVPASLNVSEAVDVRQNGRPLGTKLEPHTQHVNGHGPVHAESNGKSPDTNQKSLFSTVPQSKGNPMSTATTPAPAAASAPAVVPAPKAPASIQFNPEAIWGAGWSIPFLALTGDPGSGKTTFGLTIDPKRTIILDGEGSSVTYQPSLGFERIDLQKELGQSASQFKADHLFAWFQKFIRDDARLPAGKFSVLVIDPITVIEDGLFAFVRNNPAQFGFTPAQFARAEALMWGAGKTFWRQILTYLMTKVQTVVTVAHMRNVWQGNAPTKQREAKGKETITELASLYLRLERKLNDKGEMQTKPTGYIYENKMRLSRFVTNPESGEIEQFPALPMRISECTPHRLRWYLANPPDYSKLKKAEKVEVHQMTDDERLLLKAEIAANEARAAEMNLARQTTGSGGGAGSGSGGVPGHVPHAPPAGSAAAAVLGGNADATKAVEQAPFGNASEAVTQPANVSEGLPTSPVTVPVADPESALDSSAASEPMISDDQKRLISGLKKDLGADNVKWAAMIQKHFQVDSALKLTASQAEVLIRKLNELREKRRVKVEEEKFLTNATGHDANGNPVQGAGNGSLDSWNAVATAG